MYSVPNKEKEFANCDRKYFLAFVTFGTHHSFSPGTRGFQGILDDVMQEEKLNYTVHATKKKLHKSSSHQKRNRKKAQKKRSLVYHCSITLEFDHQQKMELPKLQKTSSISTIRKPPWIKLLRLQIALSSFYSQETSKKFRILQQCKCEMYHIIVWKSFSAEKK